MVKRDIVILILINVLVRSLWLWFMHPPQGLDFEWYYTHAVQMAHGLGYRQGHHFTAYWPIGYPFFLSLLFRVTGPSVWVGLIANALLSTMIVLLIYFVAIQLMRRRDIALFAALGYTVLPSQIEWNSVLGSEELFTVLLLSSLLMYIWSTKDGYRWSGTVLTGLILGVACDVRPIPLLFPFAMGIYEIWIRRSSLKRTIVILFYVFLGLAVGVAPVTIRNAIVMHHFIPVSTNGGVVLWQGTHADGAYFWSWNPNVNPLLAAGSNQYLQGKIGMQLFIQHVLHHPLWTVVHGLFKWGFLYWVDWNVVGVTFQVFTKPPMHWLVLTAMWFDTISYWVWMIVCGVGAMKGLRLLGISWRTIGLPMAYIVYNTAVFFFFPAWDRFRYPMMPLFAILFGIGVYKIAKLWRQRRHI